MSLLYALIGLLLSAGTVRSASGPLDLTDSEREWLQKHPKIQLGFSEGNEPYLIQAENGSLSGFYPELFSNISEILGIEIEIKVAPWNETVQKARSRAVDGLLACSPPQAKACRLLQTDHVHSFAPALFSTQTASFNIQSLSDTHGKRIAYVKETRLITDILNQHADQVSTLETDSILEAFKLVLEGKADLAFGLSFNEYQISQYSLRGLKIAYIDVEHASIAAPAVRDDWPELQSLINKSLNQIGQSKIHNVLQKWALSTAPPPKLNFTQREKEWLERNRTLTVVVDSEGMPYSYLNKRGEFTGILSDIFTEFEKQTGTTITIEPVLYNDIVNHVKAGDRQIITGFDPPDYPESERMYHKSQNIAFMPFALFAKTDSDPRAFAPENITGKTIAVINGWEPSHPAIQALGDCEIIYGADELECANLVLQGKADALFEVSSIMTFLIDRNLIGNIQMIQPSTYGLPVAIWTKKDNSPLPNIVEKVLSTISPEQRMALLKKWDINLNDPRYHLLSTVLTDQERNWLSTHSSIRVGIDPDWYPIEWQGSDGKHLGLSREYLNLLGEYLGIHLEYVPSETWTETLDNIRNRSIDLVPCTAIIEERKSFLNYTSPYLSLDVHIFVQSDANYIRDLSELNGKTLAVAADHAIADLLQRDYPKINLLQAETLTGAVKALAAGKADALAGDMLTTGHVINSLGIHSLKIGGDTPFTYDLAAGIRKDEPLLASIISKALNEISLDKREQIYSRWAPLSRPSRDLSIIWKIAVPLIALLLGVIIWNRMLKREVKRHTAALETEQTRLKEAEVIASLGHWEQDMKSGNIVWSNQMYRILELPRNTTPSFDALYNLLRPEDQRWIKTVCSQAAQSGQPISENLTVDLESGTKHLVFQCRTVCSTNPKKEFFIGTLQDITERVQIEESLFQSEKMQALGQLAGGVAHDFNNMLAGISGAAEMMGFMLPDDKELRDYQSMIMKSTKRAAALTRKLLSFSRTQPLLSENLDLHQLIKDTVALLTSCIDPRIYVSLKLEAEQASIAGDISSLQNAILNIAINASHAMPDGGQISISTAPALLDQAFCNHCQSEIKPGSYIEIDITDTGCGMSRETSKRIFEPFFTTKERDKGTGLGLATALGTIQQHGGTINVHSKIDEGTSFHIFLPVSIATKKTEPPNETLISGQGTILLVDDDEVMRVTASAILESLGYEVITADNGQTGIDAFKEHLQEIDLVILDMIMPVMNGRDCFNAIKSIKPNACILLSTGFSDQGDVEAMRQTGLCGIIHKPYLSAALSQAVHDALNCACNTIHEKNSA